MNIFDHYRQRYEAAKDEEFTLQEFLTICRQDRSAYANAAERLLMAIGEPVMVDTALEPRLSVFQTGLSHAIRHLKSFTVWKTPLSRSFPTSSMPPGLEEKKQILYLLGPVGGGKSSLAERLKALMQRVPIYVLSANGERSPVNDHPLCLFNPQEDAQILQKEYGIPTRYLGTIMSPWASACTSLAAISRNSAWLKSGHRFSSRLPSPKPNRVMKTTGIFQRWSVRWISVSWNTMRRTTRTPTATPVRCAAPTGIMEFVEMFKAPIKVLHPLLTATRKVTITAPKGSPPCRLTGSSLLTPTNRNG